MAHFNVCILVKNDNDLSLEDLAREKAWPLLDKFMGEDEESAHYDSWDLLDVIPPSEFDRFLFGKTGEKRPCGAIITPDGSWIEGRWLLGSTPEETRQKHDAWFAQMQEVLEAHKDCTVLLAECHL